MTVDSSVSLVLRSTDQDPGCAFV